MSELLVAIEVDVWLFHALVHLPSCERGLRLRARLRDVVCDLQPHPVAVLERVRASVRQAFAHPVQVFAQVRLRVLVRELQRVRLDGVPGYGNVGDERVVPDARAVKHDFLGYVLLSIVELEKSASSRVLVLPLFLVAFRAPEEVFYVLAPGSLALVLLVFAGLLVLNLVVLAEGVRPDRVRLPVKLPCLRAVVVLRESVPDVA